MITAKKTKDGIELELEFNREELAKMTVEAVMKRAEPLDHRQNMLEYFNNCSICGSDLEFSHVTQFVHGQVKEEGSCGCCGLIIKNETHALQ
jgi:hypothetical protein